MVRLKPAASSSVQSYKLHFNPTMVRLKQSGTARAGQNLIGFQSHNGSIKTGYKVAGCREGQIFQSHNGSIKTNIR